MGVDPLGARFELAGDFGELVVQVLRVGLELLPDPALQVGLRLGGVGVVAEIGVVAEQTLEAVQVVGARGQGDELPVGPVVAAESNLTYCNKYIILSTTGYCRWWRSDARGLANMY